MAKTLGRKRYSVVFSYGSTDRISNPIPVVTEIRAMLVKGGTAMIDTQRMIPATELRKWSGKMLLPPDKGGSYRYILKK